MTPIPLPEGLQERGRQLLGGRLSPEPARDSATTVLIRDDRAGLEVYLLRRKATMAFAPGAYVFPGGSVDARDSDHAIAWEGPSARAWGERLGADEALARALVCAAVRETFEESGVLLAGPADSAGTGAAQSTAGTSMAPGAGGPSMAQDTAGAGAAQDTAGAGTTQNAAGAGAARGTVVPDTSGDDWEADRLALIDKSLAFADFLDRRGLALRSDLLKGWAHWITPLIETKRFDTRFFIAAMPPGQRTRDVGGEADHVAWMSPAAAISRAEGGEIFLMPPTFATLRELAAFGSVGEVMAAEHPFGPIMPGIAEVDGRICLVMP